MKLFGFIKKALSSKEEKAFDSIIGDVRLQQNKQDASSNRFYTFGAEASTMLLKVRG